MAVVYCSFPIQLGVGAQVWIGCTRNLYIALVAGLSENLSALASSSTEPHRQDFPCTDREGAEAAYLRDLP